MQLDTQIDFSRLMQLTNERFIGRELDVIIGRYYHNMTLQSLADEYGVSPERIRQIEAKALRKFRLSAQMLELTELN
jgi:RNA polymerase sigma factor (sigma-70 family)